jgi:predicted neuraminidase
MPSHAALFARVRICILAPASLFGALVMTALGPGPAAAQHPAVRSSAFLHERAPYPQCHASTIAETAPGRLVAAWFGGSREGAPDVGIWVARFESGRWTEPVEAANGVQADGTRHPAWNPVLFAVPGQPLRLFYKVGPSPRAWWGMVKTSADGGTTWSDAARLPSPLLGPIKNKPVVLADGAWLSASSTEDSPTGWRVHVERSQDAGRTWQAIGPIDKGSWNLEAIQGSVLFHPGGRLQMVGRTRSGVLFSTWSADGGRTWTPLEALGVPNPNAGTDAVTLTDGRHLLVYNDAAPVPGTRSGKRYPLVIALSADGVTWNKAAVVEDQPMPDGYAYPAVIQASDGLVHITYTWNRQRIKHVVVDPRGLR